MEKLQQPLVSIIIAVYNGEKYLDECIKSVMMQSYSNLEIILVDDGSKDGSRKIIDRYESLDRRVKSIKKENGGVCSARNRGLDIATGEYISIVDQDDKLDSFYIEYYVDMCLKNNADIALTPSARRFNDKGFIDDLNENDSIEIWDPEKAVSNMLLYKVIIAPWNKIIKREIIEKNNLRFNENLFGGEGFLFSIMSYTLAKKIAVGHQKYYYYRIDNANSGMTSFNEKVIKSSLLSQKIISDSITNKNDLIRASLCYANWHTACDCVNTVIGCNAFNICDKTLYKKVRNIAHKDALCVFKVPVGYKEIFKGLLYFINPYFAARFINHFRARKFTKI